MANLSKMQYIAVGISAVTLPILLYLLLKSDRKSPLRILKTSLHATIDITISKDLLGQVIGKKGITIHLIEEKTNTKIRIKDNETESIATIRGKKDNVRLAEVIINRIINETPKKFEENIIVHKSFIGRIIGHHGKTIKEIQNSTHCMVIVSDLNSVDGKITLKGTLGEINLAKVEIDKIISRKYKNKTFSPALSANNDFRYNANDSRSDSVFGNDHGDSNNELKNSNTDLWPSEDIREQFRDEGVEITMNPSELELEEVVNGQVENCITSEENTDKTNDLLMICVTALISPDRFWVQFFENEVFDQHQTLIFDMDKYYNDPSTQAPSSVKLNTIVAAQFDNDTMWYRARVCAIDGDILDLFYIDYGDSLYANISKVRELRNDFLEYEPLAHECSWLEQELLAFEDKCHVTKWKDLKVRLVDYQERQSASFSDIFSVKIPRVEMYAPRDGQMVDIAEEMIKEGFAERN